MAHDVFVSHSAKDKPTADAVCAVLEAQGIRCWVAPRDVVPGKDWGESIIDAIKGARVMVLVFSTHANDSHQIKREVERAVNKGIPVIPLRIEAIQPTASLEYFLSTPHWLDAFTPPLEKHLQYLAQIIRSIIEGSLVETASMPPATKSKPEAAQTGKTEPATSSSKPTSSAPLLNGEKKKSPLLAMAIAALVALSCLGGWYFGVYLPNQRHQAELAQPKADNELFAGSNPKPFKNDLIIADALAAKKAAEELAANEAADAKAKANAEVVRQAEIKQKADELAAQKAAEELATKLATDAKSKADAEAARQAEIKQKADALAEQKAAEELATKLAADAKTKADAEATRQAALATTNHQTRPESSFGATLNKLSLSDFREIFGLKIGAKTDEVRVLFGAATETNVTGGAFSDQQLIWTYQADGAKVLKIVFDNYTKAVRSITFDQDDLPWLAAHKIDDPKLSLLGKSDIEIKKLIRQQPWNSTSIFRYEEKGLSLELICPENKRFKCSRITIAWDE